MEFASHPNVPKRLHVQADGFVKMELVSTARLTRSAEKIRSATKVVAQIHLVQRPRHVQEGSFAKRDVVNLANPRKIVVTTRFANKADASKDATKTALANKGRFAKTSVAKWDAEKTNLVPQEKFVKRLSVSLVVVTTKPAKRARFAKRADASQDAERMPPVAKVRSVKKAIASPVAGMTKAVGQDRSATTANASKDATTIQDVATLLSATRSPKSASNASTAHTARLEKFAESSFVVRASQTLSAKLESSVWEERVVKPTVVRTPIAKTAKPASPTNATPARKIYSAKLVTSVTQIYLSVDQAAAPTKIVPLDRSVTPSHSLVWAV